MMKKMLMSILILCVLVPAFALENNTLLNETNNDSGIPVNDSNDNQTSFSVNQTDNGTQTAVPVNQSELNDSLSTDKELAIMYTPQGIMLRFTQLQDQIEINIQKGEIVINKIIENNNDSDISNLTVIIDELKLIINESEYYTIISNINDTKAATEKFVELKTQTVALFKEYKLGIRDLISPVEITHIKDQTKNLTSKYKDVIKQRLLRYNRENVRKVSKYLNLNNETIDEMFNGTSSREQVMENIKTRLQSMNATNLNQMKVEIKRVVIQNKDLIQRIRNDVKEVMKDNMTKAIAQRVRTRVSKIIKNKTMQKINRLIAKNNITDGEGFSNETVEEVVGSLPDLVDTVGGYI